jgi:hypothetical protein
LNLLFLVFRIHHPVNLNRLRREKTHNIHTEFERSVEEHPNITDRLQITTRNHSTQNKKV